MKITTTDQLMTHCCRDVWHGKDWRAGFYQQSAAYTLPRCFLQDTAMCYQFANMQGLWELVKVLQHSNRWHDVQKQGNSSDTEKAGHWCKTDSLDDCINKMINEPQWFCQFDPDENKILEEDSSGNQIIYDVVGEYLDVGRYLDNEPECFGVSLFGRQSVKFCTININLSASCAIDSKAISYRNSCICKLVDFLEHNNVHCRVKGFENTQCVHTEIMIKDFVDPLNINDVALISSPDFLRRILFLLAEFSPTWDDSYGFATGSHWHYEADSEATFTLVCDTLGDNDIEGIEKAYKTVLEHLQNGVLLKKAMAQENYVYKIRG